MIVNDNPSLTIVNTIVKKKNFKNDRFLKTIRFLKVQNEWVVFKDDLFFENVTIVFENETKNDRLQDLLTTLTVQWSPKHC